MPQNLSAQIVGLSPQFWDFEKASLGVRSWCNDLVPLFLILDATPIGADTLKWIAFKGKRLP